MATSKPKALFLSFSLTGNTRFVAEQIGNGLRDDCGYDVIHIDVIPVIKALHLGEVHHDKEIVPKLSKEFLDEIEVLNDLKKAIQSAEVFGIGSVSWGSNPAPGFVFLLEEILSPSLFENLKYFCVYSSYGALPPQISSVFANIMKKKNNNAKFLGDANVVCPQNGVGFLPFKPEYDGMSNKELKKLEINIKRMTNSIRTKQFPSVPSPVWFSRIPMRENARKANTRPLLNKEKCIRCGLCARSCPYNVIAIKKGSGMGKTGKAEGGGTNTDEKKGREKEKRTCNDVGDIEDGYPVWMDVYEKDWGKKDRVSADESGASECWRCGRCFNLCPREAIDFSETKNVEGRSRYKGPVLVAAKNSSSPSLKLLSTPAAVKLPPDAVVRENPGGLYFFPRLLGLDTKKTNRLYLWIAVILLSLISFFLLFIFS